MTDTGPAEFDQAPQDPQPQYEELESGRGHEANMRRAGIGWPPRRGLFGALVAIVAAAALLLLSVVFLLGRGGNGPLQTLQPDHQARQVALAYARSEATLQFAASWRMYATCYQQENPLNEWVALKESEANGASVAPPDTDYRVIAVTPAGGVDRVEVRVTAPTGRQLDYEVDVTEDQGREVVVDTGDLGHPISDCTRRGS
jgi:hypothetical protein